MAYDPDTTERLIAAGWVVREGNHLIMTAVGKKALRRGITVGGVPGEKALPVDSVRARTRTPIKKLKHRK